MSLDMFPGDQAEAIDYARRTSAAQLPATFGDTFAASWSHGALFGQSVAGATARRSVVDDFVEDVRRRHGVTLATPTVDGAPTLDDINIALSQNPHLTDVKPLTPEDVDQRAIEKSRGAREAFKAMGEREQTFGGKAGAFFGDAASQLADPINLVALPLGAPLSMGVLKTALVMGGIGVGTQGVIEAVGTPYRDQVDPAYSGSAEQAQNLLGAAVAPAVLGGGIKALANAWARVRTGEWPRNVRDAGNVVESEAQIADTNPFKGVDGEVAHRQAVTKALDDLLADRPVDVDALVRDLAPDEARLPPEAALGDAQAKLDIPAPGEPPPAILQELAPDLTAKRRQEIRADPETDDAVALDLDRVRATKDFMYPSGETIDAQGQRTAAMRSIDDDIAHIEKRESAAAEIKLCASPQPETAQ